MICLTCERDKLGSDGRCTVYSLEGMFFRDRRGYCPIGGPHVVKKDPMKTRVGQQKQKKKAK